MAVLTRTFRHQSETIQHEHEALVSELAELEYALQSLVCYSEVFANLATAERVYRCGRHLSKWLPGHFENEEATVLADLEKASPELAAFAREMKQQHRRLRELLESFCRAMDEVENSPSLEESIAAVKDIGLEFSRQLAIHMGAEERQFSSLLAKQATTGPQ